MRILALTNLYPSTREPTRGVFNLNAFQVLARRCEMRLLAPMPWWYPGRATADWKAPPWESHTGVPACFPTYWSVPRLHALHGWGMYLSLRARVQRLRREFPFDIVLAAWAYPDAVAAARLARSVGCPLVTMVLGSDLNELPRRAALRGQIRWGLLQARRVVAVSGALAQRVVDLGIPADRVVVQHNGVDGERFRPRDRAELRERLGLSRERPTLCFVGNFKPEKGVPVLIDAMSRLRYFHGREDVLLTLVGDGVLEGSLRERVREHRLEDQILFCGRRPHMETADWIGAADALCLPSYREGCPNVILEALASGRPVVASAVGGIPEILDDRGGALVRAGSAESLAAGIASVLERSWDPAALRATVPCLSWGEFAGRLQGILETALQERRAGEARGTRSEGRPGRKRVADSSARPGWNGEGAR